jgi:hypothetical protein
MRQAETQKEVAFSKSTSFSPEELALFQKFLEFMKEKKAAEGFGFPISIFNEKLSPQETVIKFLRENLHYDYNKISELLHKNPGPVGITYRNAAKKMPASLDISSEIFIPLEIFDDHKTVFESIVLYLVDVKEFSFKKISSLMHRNYRTVWTIYQRAKKK